MMKSSDGKIGTREFIALILLTIGLKQTDITPSTLFPLGMTATWMLPIISACVTVIPFLLLLFLLRRYKDKGLLDIIYELTGKYIGFVIGVILFLYMLTTTTVVSRSYADIMGVMYFPRTPLAVLLFLFMLISYLISSRGLEAIGRTSWLTVPYFKLSLILLLILIFSIFNWRNVFPLGGSGLETVSLEGIKHSNLFSEIIIFTVLFPFVRGYKEFRLASLLGLAITLVELVVFYLVFIMVYDYPSVKHIAFPFQQLTRMINLGPVFGNTESLFIGFWAIASITRLSIYLYITVLIFSYVMKLSKFKTPLFLIAIIIFILGLFFDTNIDSVLFVRDNLLYQLNWLLILCLPLFLWVIDRIKSRRHAK